MIKQNLMRVILYFWWNLNEKLFLFRVAGQEGSLKVCKQPTAVIFLQQPTIELWF